MSPLKNIIEGFIYVKNHPILPGLYLLDIGVTVVSFYRQIMPLIADRLFKGFVIHKGGKEAFVGVIKSDSKNFFWADSSDDDGKVIGTILKKNKIETCYLDSGKDAVAGCSILLRQD